jgi:serine phosphatase RsbU (regulator of sigma subunit)/DNA-binding response OmpR family regulator/anti-sigma regulatory factor (Ser/Thr protein kinase)
MKSERSLQSGAESEATGADGQPTPLPGSRARDQTAIDEPVGILLVDDNHENLVALEAVLEPLGERLVTAHSGDEGLRALLYEEIAVILLDVRMAGLDGLETARIIRSRPATRRIPIIFLTAQASDVEEIAMAYATGAVDYVIKPFEPEILRAKVSVFAELSRERSERARQSHARAEAEAVARTVRTLQILSDTALAHLDLDGLASELLDRVGTLFQADSAALLLRDENAPSLYLQSSRGGPLPAPAHERVMLGQGTLGELASERRSALLGGAELAQLQPVGSDEADDRPIESLLVVPLIASDQLLGLMVLGAGTEERFDGGDLELLTLAADRMAIAFDHVQLFSQGRQLVETLQRSLLPDRLPRHPRLELAARYLPSGVAPGIGGDWYDALELDNERTAVMIGDVVGHGVRAATTMSELRNALRAFAVEGHTPREALAQLNRVVHATLGPGMIATVLFVIIDAAEGTVTLAGAGHPPPALRDVDGKVRFLETENTPPLGVDRQVAPHEAQYPIRSGATLLLFTDGLVERRRESIAVGYERLQRAFESAPAGVEEICDHVLERTIAEQPSDDDVALLVVRLLAYSAGPLDLTLPASPDSVPLARHRLRAWLNASAPGLDPLIRSDLEVAWSEACTNVVLHAYASRNETFTARAAIEPRWISLQVSDHGRWREPRIGRGGRGLAVMRELADELLIDRRSDGTTVTIRRGLEDLLTETEAMPGDERGPGHEL